MMMAKPKHGRLVQPAPIPPPRKRLHSPSPAVLSALALIATIPPVVVGTPHAKPPDFLCPFVHLEDDHGHLPHTLSPTPTFSSKCHVVADKYIQGSDSLWRKTDAWTLYGSTCCSTTTPCVGLSRSSSSQVPVPPSPSAANFDTSVLPAGWNNPPTTKSNTESTIIFALSIVLAGFICFLVIGCVIWRRRKRRARDIERKHGHKPSVHGSRDKMRMWTKATSQWKSNIRQSARRRRKRYPSSIVHRPSSPVPSPLSLLSPSVHAQRGSIATGEVNTYRLEAIVTDSPAVLHGTLRSASPPTYGAYSLSRLHPNSATSESPWTHSQVDADLDQRSDKRPSTEDEPIPYVPPHDGHVATDDKSQLAHIRELASSPPTITDTAIPNTMHSVSAPEWHEVEDDLEDLDLYLSEAPMFHNGFPPAFPSPPSKAVIPLPFGYVDNPPLPLPLGVPGNAPSESLDDSGTGEYTRISSPPFDDPGLEPSAPFLEGEDELLQDWEAASSCDPEGPTPVILDSTPRCHAIQLSISSTSEHAAGDGILPRYNH